MGHGTPDWGQTAGVVTTYQLTDLAEHAARLGSIVRHDRRGEVILLDSFEAGLAHWNPVPDGDGSVVDLTVTKSRTGLFAARLVAGAAAGRSAAIDWNGAYPALSRFGWEVAFSLPSAVGNVRLSLGLRTGAQTVTAGVEWDEASMELRYYNTAGGYTAIRNTGILWHSAYNFHVLKVVMDGETHKYVRVVFDNTEDDLSGIGCYKSDSIGNPGFTNNVYCGGRDAGTSTIYVDDVILTQNEPAQPT